jgi:hypothetical protein
MLTSRRTALKLAGLTGIRLTLPHFAQALEEASAKVTAKGNPIIPGVGACDPQVRIYDGEVYLYATHDASAKSTTFTMNDWWVWHSSDLVNWERVSVLKPEQTYFKKPSSQCWATDAARRNGMYFFYFSMGPEDVGVVAGPTPAGPWHDPIGHALIAKGQVKTASRDPGIFQEADGTSYIVFGTFDYYIARLNEDMVSLAETPKLIEIQNPEGPYGKGRTDDKPFLHRRGDSYYLSWGCYYSISKSLYGPYLCKGSIIHQDRLDAEFLDPSNRTAPQAPPAPYAPKDWLGFDRHGSFFELHGQWYFICNDQALPGSNTLFRNSVISYVRYKDSGEMDPIRLTAIGVGQYDAAVRIEATDFFKADKAQVREDHAGRFQVRDLQNGSSLVYPKIRNIHQRTKLAVSASSVAPAGAQIDVHRGSLSGPRLATLNFKPIAGDHNDTMQAATLNGVRDTDNLCLVVRGGPGELIRLNHLMFS